MPARGFVKNTERLAFTNAAAGTPQVQNLVYGYDAVGNVNGRADLINNVSETFGYDSLDRLTASTVTNGSGAHAVTYAYDDDAGNLGDMTHKSDISTSPSASMSYSTTARPHVAGREKLSYDAWGKRRHGTDWWSAAATASEERGYTGHEHLDNVALIHMNGRAYDPLLARFTSPDPFVPAPLYSQSYNRYAYVYASPLNYTDPSGYEAREGTIGDRAAHSCAAGARPAIGSVTTVVHVLSGAAAPLAGTAG